jgi:hypothetical protein
MDIKRELRDKLNALSGLAFNGVTSKWQKMIRDGFATLENVEELMRERIKTKAGLLRAQADELEKQVSLPANTSTEEKVG